MLKQYKVTLSFQYPAWDEVNGIDYEIAANSKSEAVKRVRRQAENDGHAASGKGRYSFKAVEVAERDFFSEYE